MKKPRKKPFHIKMSEAQKKAIQKKANFYCEGNISKWMRYAAMHFVPHDGELIKG